MAEPALSSDAISTLNSDIFSRNKSRPIAHEFSQKPGARSRSKTRQLAHDPTPTVPSPNPQLGCWIVQRTLGATRTVGADPVQQSVRSSSSAQSSSGPAQTSGPAQRQPSSPTQQQLIPLGPVQIPAGPFGPILPQQPNSSSIFIFLFTESPLSFPN
ncbi:hypothetical protein CRG98_025879 [Punica granatum]|uniref:Uncharacterized protein n=1 Tax=Punica granatum TaxID=22663 RepID=A0A2I0JBY4_PUNGR|nr:hypothetical protein CRG98_025879 [Punica granatum]